MKKIFSFISLFICAFMLVGLFPVNAATYDTYNIGDTITKEMTSGKKVTFTVVEDQGVNSQYVKVIANPAGLSQFGVKVDYNHDDLLAKYQDSTEMVTFETGIVGDAVKTSLAYQWSQNGTIQLDDSHKMTIFTLSDYQDFVKKYYTKKKGSEASDLSTAINFAKESNVFSGQTFWLRNVEGAGESTATLGYDRISNGTYATDDTSDTINLTIMATICKTPKKTKTCYCDSSSGVCYGSTGSEVSKSEYQKQCGNPDTADNNIIALSIVGIGCVICIVIFGRKILEG